MFHGRGNMHIKEEYTGEKKDRWQEHIPTITKIKQQAEVDSIGIGMLVEPETLRHYPPLVHARFGRVRVSDENFHGRLESFHYGRGGLYFHARGKHPWKLAVEFSVRMQ